MQPDANNEFTCQALRVSLLTSQLNATMFHLFITVFSLMNN